MVHTWEQTKETWCRVALGTSSKLNMATSLRSRSKKKTLILLMMMMLADESSVSKQVARKSWARLWLLRRQEKGALYYFSRTVQGRFRRIL